MNIYHPYLVYTSTDGLLKEVRVVKDYELFFIDVKDMFFVNKTTQYLSIEKIELSPMNFYSGFFIEQRDGVFAALDLRVNEGMLFSAPTVEALKLQIENLLHSLALDESRARMLKLKQDEKLSTR